MKFFLILLLPIFITIIIGCENNNIYKKYYPSGKLKVQAEVKDSVYHGKYYEYYENGKLKFEVTYLEGRKQGISKNYYMSGNISQVSNWRDGRLEGYVNSYYENGNLEAKLPYTNDTMIGKSFFYYDNGKIKEESYIGIFDTIVGVTFWRKSFDKEGNLIDMYHVVEITPSKELDSDNYKLHIKLKGAKNEKITVFIGGFDENYHYIGGEQDTVYSNTLEATYLYKPKKSGKNIVRGIIKDYKERQHAGGGKTIDETYAYFTDTLDVKLRIAL